MIVSCKAIAHFAQAGNTGDRLQFAIAIGRAGQTVERMVGNIQLHHIAPQFVQRLALRFHLHARFHRRGTRGGITAPSGDFHQTHATRAKRFQRVGRTQLRNLVIE